ncbi:tRNA 2-thiouridine(34) synthase MnmA [Anaerosalibacter bizertensis]|uniref:tRNA-specific 2-thiouridylase MnmA n=1 Tax=Anaerosalibacter bizertensis TaxID=932217 RepID=A0A9Q4ABD5_9FIRM|nr:tRNA 2-thiouridine(34) synthase MnmA [Anaerosalibacter bizertensis]MBV1818236.1 tRNA 2-thiouridine(34) synthase MnmA [Bacteroidales bacterium MSK.15.36]MCB5559387.1 tRNA 2-thiouridine(34) synthase MnmA [Anaerosalibacter bizertensis]MCG4564582.1 tRNA 2-thiouridine(34) synthase MnmA [Anaerosalibacter bizertensis]MCG4583079.1 tRNA 2-thiouridine(34) synthase MnmA [Anaerosalibacter bizertensis]MCG4584474.1 tRNA 2-thiouridine(34) synthase MnmA [Anaerosalibacter bizertensis]
MKKKVVLGMSGGVDSSVAAYILKEAGYDVIGVTMTMIPKDEEFDEKEGGCCSISSVNDARKVAEKLDIPFYVMNFKDVFERKVINYFVDEYLQGRTPNPCVVCNKYIKFDEFLRKAEGLGAYYVATGHYANIEKDESTDRYLLKRAADSKKDQTYFLYNMTQYQLEHTLMPLYNITKDRVREIAEKIDLNVHNKPDSEEICFIPDDDHGKFIKNREPDKVKPGYFVDENGNTLGKHKGIVYYTVGQRKGLGIAVGRKVFVQKIIPEKNLIVIGDEDKIFKSKLYAEDINIIPYDNIPKDLEVTAKVRYSMKETKALVNPHKDGAIVEFKSPQRAITKGQSVVFYDGDVVVGGGIIKEVY